MLKTLRTIVPLVVLAAAGLPSGLAQEDADVRVLFNGTDLSGWDGDPKFWRVEDGVIIGETTADNTAERNTFLIFRDGEFGDFELSFEYQVAGYNSGVQYRSLEKDKWSIAGYQADFEARWHDSDAGPVDRFSGMFFEEQGRMFLGQRGEAVIVRTNPENPRKPKIERVASLGDPTLLESHIHRDDWNRYRVIAKGYQFTHIINDYVMAMGIDEDRENRRASGLIAFQLHSGPPMQIKLRNIRIRDLTD